MRENLNLSTRYERRIGEGSNLHLFAAVLQGPRSRNMGKVVFPPAFRAGCRKLYPDDAR